MPWGHAFSPNKFVILSTTHYDNPIPALSSTLTELARLLQDANKTIQNVTSLVTFVIDISHGRMVWKIKFRIDVRCDEMCYGLELCIPTKQVQDLSFTHNKNAKIRLEGFRVQGLGLQCPLVMFRVQDLIFVITLV